MCGKTLYYTSKYRLLDQERKKGVCYSCRANSRSYDYITPEFKKKLSVLMTKRFAKMTEEEKRKWIKMGKIYSLRQKPLTEEEKKARSGKGNNFYGKHHSREQRKKWSKMRKGKAMPLETRMKISKTLKEKKINCGNRNCMKRPEVRNKVRLATLKNLKEKYGNITPTFNLDACKYFDKLNKKRKWNLIHAKNGGEYYISELGYWLDAYDKERNIVVEYDEPKHYTILENLKEKDVKRQKEIIQHLKCRFFRFDEKRNKFYQI